MTKKYKEVPNNFDDIKQYIIYNKESVIDKFFKGSIMFFYDTCSIRHHSNSDNRNYIIEYLLKKQATIIITRTVLMELSPNTYLIHPDQIRYIKELYDSGLDILLFNEEFVFDCLKEFMNISNKEANLLLGYSVKHVSKHKTKTYEILHYTLSTKFSEQLKGHEPGNRELYTRFFKIARSSKESEDSLAEELILICTIVLSRMSRGKFVFFSDDLKARVKIIDTKRNIKEWHHFEEFYQLTTAATVYKIHKLEILIDEAKMLEIMVKAYGNFARIFFISEFCMEQNNGKFECSEIIDRILGEDEFRIMY